MTDDIFKLRTIMEYNFSCLAQQQAEIVKRLEKIETKLIYLAKYK